MQLITILLWDTGDISAALREVTSAAGPRATSLRPLHAASTDERLKRYYTLEVADEAASEVVAELRRCRAVEGAFIKPRNALP